jgi:UDP-N-acetylmuramate dehydrogenase
LTLLNYRHMIHMPILFLGGGSNVLLTRDFAGIVIKISSKGMVIREEDENQVMVTAEAGENWDDFVRYCVGNGWAGLENLSLIPGTVGAAPIQNIGAYGVEVKDHIESVLVAHLDSGKERRLSNDECRFGCRDSIFKQELKGKVIVLSVTFRLAKCGQVDGWTGGPGSMGTGEQGNRGAGERGSRGAGELRLDYGDIRGELERMGVEDPGIADVRQAVINIRRRKLPDPAEVGNVGSFFKNPVVSKDTFKGLQQQFHDIPSFPVPADQPGSDDCVKIPAAWLIEQCGWKGFREGDTGVWPGQPLVLVNYGSATGQQILDLADRIIASVRQKFGITLAPEVNIIN